MTGSLRVFEFSGKYSSCKQPAIDLYTKVEDYFHLLYCYCKIIK